MDSPNRLNFLAAIFLATATALLLCAQELCAQELSAQEPTTEKPSTQKPSTQKSATKDVPATAPKTNHNSLRNATDGVTVNKSGALAGYTLVAPMNSTRTYLIDMDGRVVNVWKSQFTPALSAYLLENGNLLRPGSEPSSGVGGPGAGGPGAGGRIQEFTWDGELVWDYSFGDSNLRPHHDICRLPNGNVLVIASDPKSKDQAIAAGRRPESVRALLVPDCILEIKPTGKTTGEIVWRWHAWDHLVQDFDKQMPNYGDVSEHPELVDVNFSTGMMDRMMQDPEQLARLRSLGYVGGGNSPPADASKADASKEASKSASKKDAGSETKGSAPVRTVGPGGGPTDGDWMHVNSVAYNAKLDQIMISVHEFHEVWVIDHSTTTEEAASHQGGKSGKGGDILFRWGNPKAYRSGSNVEQRLYAQHNAHWIEDGAPGAGNMLVFNNGSDRPDGDYSSVEEVVLPVNEQGGYDREEFTAFAPEKAKWSFSASDKASFYSSLISGAQRLPNGNTFICSGDQAILFEVSPNNEIVWQYKHPGGSSGLSGPGQPDGPPKPGELVPRYLARILEITVGQREQINKLQEDVERQLGKMLTAEQLEIRNRPDFTLAMVEGPQVGPQAGAGPPRIGEVLPKFIVDRLELTRKQKTDLVAIQKQSDERLNKVWSDKQKAKLQEMKDNFALGLGFKPSGGGPPAGKTSGSPSSPGGGLSGPVGIFRSYRYGADYAAFKGRDLAPGEKLEVLARPTSGPTPGRPPGPAGNSGTKSK